MLSLPSSSTGKELLTFNINDTTAYVLADSAYINYPPPDSVGIDKMPEPTFNPPPQYPEEARIKGIENMVWVKAWVTQKGNIRQTKILQSSDVLFNKIALRCVLAWKFKPALKDNRPVDVWVSIPLKFSLRRTN
jgi:protein TonB